MGMDLSGVGGFQRFSNASWRMVLQMAYEYGWKPQGTELGRWYDENGELNKQLSRDPDTWNSTNYFTNDFQWVTEVDAANIANALEQALANIPNSDIDEKPRQKLRDFIRFCRAGEFCIG